MDAAVWFKRIKCLVLVCIFASIGNFISTSKARNPVTPIEAIPGLVLLLACTLIGCLIYELVGKVSSKNLPAIAYISFIAIFMTIPGVSPIAEYAIEQVGKIGLLPLCTPDPCVCGNFHRQGYGYLQGTGTCDRDRSDLYFRRNIPGLHDHRTDHSEDDWCDLSNIKIAEGRIELVWILPSFCLRE